MGVKFCPKCQSEQVYMEAGGYTGVWTCSSCSFSGPIFPEKEREEENDE